MPIGGIIFCSIIVVWGLSIFITRCILAPEGRAHKYLYGSYAGHVSDMELVWGVILGPIMTVLALYVWREARKRQLLKK